jgi:hypothetical protein
LRGLGLEQFIGGNLQHGEPNDHGGVHAQPRQPLAEVSNFCATASVARFLFSVRPTVRLVVVHLGFPTSMQYIHYSPCFPIRRTPLVVIV